MGNKCGKTSVQQACKVYLFHIGQRPFINKVFSRFYAESLFAITDSFLGSAVHTTLREFENRSFALKAHNVFRRSTLSRVGKKFKKTRTQLSFCIFMFEKTIVYEKLRYCNIFCPSENKKLAFQIPPV